MENDEVYHPSSRIFKSYSDSLSGKCIVLGVTASISIYRSLDTARWLMRRGAMVQTIMTQESAKFVNPDMFYWATGVRPIVNLTGETEHISLASRCDSMLIAPATLSTMSKIAYSISDNPVSLTAISFLGFKKPLVLVPAMHINMMKTKQYEEIEKRIVDSGIFIINPYFSEDIAKYPDPQFVARVSSAHTLRGYDMKSLKVLVTAGATRNWVDDIRFVSNPSSGRMGIEIAIEAYSRGAQVELLHGHTEVQVPHTIQSYYCETTEEMSRKIRELTEKNQYDIIIGAAAPVDFEVENRFKGKLRSENNYDIKLVASKKVLNSIAKKPKVLISFAAESINNWKELYKKAREKIEKYKADMVVANPANISDVGFSSLYDKVAIILKEGPIIDIDKTLKENLARIILDRALNMVKGVSDEDKHQ